MKIAAAISTILNTVLWKKSVSYTHLDTAVTAVFGKEPVIVFSGTYADITAQNGSLNSGSFVFMHTPMLEFLAAPHFGYELTAWTVNGNAITSGIEPVSYTHLDVYKRQPLLFRQRLQVKRNR